MFIWFNKDNNPKSHFRTSENATWVEKPRGPVAGSFQHTHTVTTQLSIIVLFLVGSSTCSPHIDYSGQDSLTRIFFQLQYFSPDSRLARTKTEIPIRSIQNADWRPGTKFRLQTEKFILFSTFFPILITTNAQVFLSHNCPKIRGNLFHKSWKLT